MLKDWWRHRPSEGLFDSISVLKLEISLSIGERRHRFCNSSCNRLKFRHYHYLLEQVPVNSICVYFAIEVEVVCFPLSADGWTSQRWWSARARRVMVSRWPSPTPISTGERSQLLQPRPALPHSCRPRRLLRDFDAASAHADLFSDPPLNICSSGHFQRGLRRALRIVEGEELFPFLEKGKVW